MRPFRLVGKTRGGGGRGGGKKKNKTELSEREVSGGKWKNTVRLINDSKKKKTNKIKSKNLS